MLQCVMAQFVLLTEDSGSPILISTQSILHIKSVHTTHGSVLSEITLQNGACILVKDSITDIARELDT